MLDIPWIMLIIGLLILVLAVIAYFHYKRSGCGFDYYSVFIVGGIWIIFGIILKVHALWIVGIIFFLTGLFNKKKWRKRCMWVDLSGRDKWMKILMIIVLVVLLIAGIILYLYEQGII